MFTSAFFGGAYFEPPTTLTTSAVMLSYGSVVDPQGGVRSTRPWGRGAAHLSLVTGAPLVPVHLIGTARALSPGRIGFPKVRVIVGEPIEVTWDQEDPAAATKLTERLRMAVESLA